MNNENDILTNVQTPIPNVPQESVVKEEVVSEEVKVVEQPQEQQVQPVQAEVQQPAQEQQPTPQPQVVEEPVQEEPKEEIQNTPTKVDNSNVISIECPNCGATLITAAGNISLKCHWCHTVMQTDKSVNNPKIPDRILPFKVSKEEAVQKINDYLKDKKKRAKKEFLAAFKPEEVIPVYLPYMLVDVKAHTNISGIGEVDPEPNVGGRVKTITVCNVKKDFDLLIEDLMIESSKISRFNSNNATNHVISAVSPFDTENSVEFNANFLNGFSSENRELDIVEIKSKIQGIVEDISASEAKKMYDQFNRGVLWSLPESSVLGTQWTSAFLPLWLYSYYEKETGIRYYIAVNGRTGKTVGSIPCVDFGLKIDAFKNFLIHPMSIISLTVIIGFLVLAILVPELDILKWIGIIMLFIYSLFAYFGFYKRLDDEREKYSSDKKSIDYITQAKYKTANINSSDDIIDSYDTSKRGYAVEKNSSSAIVLK